MPSDAFIGILTGLGDAHRARQKNIFDQEVARREQMAKAFEKLAEHPSITPEGAEQYYKQAFTIRTSDVSKPLPKDVDKFATEITPKFGQSWLGGQTVNKVEATNLPIGSDLEGGATLKDIQGGQVPGVGDKVQSTRTPPPSQYEAPMPQPPPGVQRSAFYSPQELYKQEIAAAVAKLQALGPIQRQQALAEEQDKLSIQPPRIGSANAEDMLYETDPRTGKTTIIHKPELKPVKPPNLSQWHPDTVSYKGKATDIITDLDPESPTFGHMKVRGTGEDITGQPVDHYERPREFAPDRGDTAAGRKEVMAAYNELKDGRLRMAAMKAAKARADASANPGASDMVLLSNHIGMTFGNVKGARTGRDLIEAHMQARSLPESLAVLAGGVLKGQQLSKEQREEFLHAAEARLSELEAAYQQAQDVWQYTPPGERRRAQFSPSTNQYRHTTDGGKTWLSGRLPR